MKIFFKIEIFLNGMCLTLSFPFEY